MRRNAGQAPHIDHGVDERVELELAAISRRSMRYARTPAY
jgi:hypothetical protein